MTKIGFTIRKAISFTMLSAAVALTLASCKDDFEVTEPTAEILPGSEDNYVLQVRATLDFMGGEKGVSLENTNEAIESYIDPEKFRVLFFTHDDETGRDWFLFESKSRWVKKLVNNGGEPRWEVSIPVYTVGNDLYEDLDPNDNKDLSEYNWAMIREYLTSRTFKISILANRPDFDFYPGYDNNSADKGITGLPEGYFDNRGPFWGPENSIASYTDEELKTPKVQALVKEILSLHHSQFDPIYTGKSYPGNDAITNKNEEGYYDFIMGDPDITYKKFQGDYRTAKNRMGSTSMWVYPPQSDKRTNGSSGARECRWPDEDYPIPMYGVQQFNKIEGWEKGTPFNLSANITGGMEHAKYETKTIFLLRSVVRIELLIPKTLVRTEPEFVALCYSNVNARCEPMDVWTPTEQLWGETESEHDALCEFQDIVDYGPVTRLSDRGTLPDFKNNTYNTYTTKGAFQKRIKWFYGIWAEKGWEFKTEQGTTVTGETQTAYGKSLPPSPRVFNSCVQRNGIVTCDKYCKSHTTDYWRYIVYTGERNVNDPSYLYGLGNKSAGGPTTIYWMFNIGTSLYGLPITDYSSITGNNNELTGIVTGLPGYTLGSTSVGSNQSFCNNTYQPNVQNMTTYPNSAHKPWPLIRNHVYRLVLTQTKSEDLPFSVTSKVLRSSSAPQ